MNMLNDPQRTAVLHPSGPLLLFAGAGSGKTRTLTYRIANLIAEHRVPPYRILAVTFTNKAASEMRERLRQIVGDDIARDLYIGTFHGMAAKFLRRYAQAAGLSGSFTIYDDSDQKALVSRALKSLELDERVYSVKAVLGRISAHKREGKDPLEDPLTAGLDSDVDALGREYQTLLGRANAVDFDDLLLKVLRLVEDPQNPAGRELRRKFEHVLVDEFQDTNWVQYRIVRALSAESRNLCVVGDDDQSIYRWRGADVRIIRGFKHDFPEAEVIKLEQNYRSTGNIVAAALAVIEKASLREPKELWTEAPAGDPIFVRGVSDERAEAAFIAGQVERARRSGQSPKELAIFYRTHAQSRVLEESLRSLNLPYQIVGGMKFFERAEIKDMLAYLRVIHNPSSDTDLARIINVPTRGIGQKSISRLVEIASAERCTVFDALSIALADASLGASATKKLGLFADLLADFRKASESLRPSELVERILGDTGYRRILEEEDSAESDARLQNLAEFVGSLSEYESEAPVTGEEPNLAGYLERVALVAAVDSMNDSPMVSMMTVHSAKGLEFDQVWLTGMEEETFPYKGFGEGDPEDLDEERRLAYVAITRARKHLTITYAASRFLFGRTKYLAPSRFLEDLPDAAVRREGAPSRPPFANPAFSSGMGRPSFASSTPRETASFSRSKAAEIQVRPGERFIDREHGEPGHDSDIEAVTVRPGQRVRHVRFGQGVVEGVESGAKPTVIVRFPGYGTRRIVAEYLDFGS